MISRCAIHEETRILPVRLASTAISIWVVGRAGQVLEQPMGLLQVVDVGSTLVANRLHVVPLGIHEVSVLVRDTHASEHLQVGRPLRLVPRDAAQRVRVDARVLLLTRYCFGERLLGGCGG